MWILWWSLVGVGWFAWLFPFIFRAPHKQQRPSITVAGPTRIGLLLELLAVVSAFVFHTPLQTSPEPIRIVPAAVLLDLALLMRSEPATAVTWAIRSENFVRVLGGGAAQDKSVRQRHSNTTLACAELFVCCAKDAVMRFDVNVTGNEMGAPASEESVVPPSLP